MPIAQGVMGYKGLERPPKSVGCVSHATRVHAEGPGSSLRCDGARGVYLTLICRGADRITDILHADEEGDDDEGNAKVME